MVLLLARGITWAAPDPLANPVNVHVLLFVRSDCPITNRYAPELARIAREFAERKVDFWLIYPDSTETEKTTDRHRTEYGLPGIAVVDPRHKLVKRAGATVSPQAAVFDHAGHLTYSGRIDNRYLGFGKSMQEPSSHDLEAAISSTLAGRRVSAPRTRAVGCYLADLR